MHVNLYLKPDIVALINLICDQYSWVFFAWNSACSKLVKTSNFVILEVSDRKWVEPVIEQTRKQTDWVIGGVSVIFNDNAARS